MKVYHKAIHFKTSTQSSCYHYFDIRGEKNIGMILRLSITLDEESWWSFSSSNLFPTKRMSSERLKRILLVRILSSQITNLLYFYYLEDLNLRLIQGLVSRVVIGNEVPTILSSCVISEWDIQFTPEEWMIVSDQISRFCESSIENFCNIWMKGISMWESLHATTAKVITSLMYSRYESKA